jgi:ubiquinone/menaquinone biosynthesis C-methylase UbiE
MSASARGLLDERRLDTPRSSLSFMPDPHRTPARTREDVADLYSRVAPTYTEHGPPYFAHAGRRLAELTGVQPGDAVLDLGTGRGAVLLPAAERVGSGGSALGIDIAPGMITQTNRAIQDAGLHSASARLMDVTSLQLESGAFTHVLSSFSVFFFPDLPGVLLELRRVLKPNGVVGFAFSRGTDPRWTWYEEMLRGYGAFEGLPAPTGDPRVRERGRLTALLEDAGFADVHEREEPTELWYPSPEAWWASLWTHGSRRGLERLTPEQLARVEAASLERVRAMAEPRGVPERMLLVYVMARTPSDSALTLAR